MTTDRFAGVGASGFSFRTSISSAGTRYTQAIHNIGDAPAPLVVDYTIPEIVVATWAPSSVYGPQASAAVEMIVTYFTLDGEIRGEETLFHYLVDLKKDRPNAGVHGHSWDIVGLNHVPIFETGNVFGIGYPEITGSARLPLLAPGETVAIEYGLAVEGRTGATPEVGYHALIGDPFNVGTKSGFSVSLAPTVAVPEPTTVLLLPAALLGMLFAFRRKRRANSA